MKYSLSAFYRDFTKEKVLKESLRNGKILSKNEINELVSNVVRSTKNFTKPLLSTVDNYIENGEVSSAKKTNEIFKAAESDLTVSVLSLLDQEEKISNLYDSAYSKLNGLQNKVALLRSDIEKVLFESKNTDTHEELFYEKFDSLDMVDKKLTTAAVDINLNEVGLKATEQYPIDLGSNVDSISVVPEKNTKIVDSVDIGDMVIGNIISNNNKVWMHQVSTTEPLSSITVDLIMRIPSPKTEINKILLEPYSVDLRTQVNIELAYSDDGLNWIYPKGEYKKRMQKSTGFSFKGEKREYWRIRFTKLGNDGFFSNFYVYNFGLKSLNFQGKVYDKVSRLDLGYFYSKPIIFKQNAELAQIKVCDEIPEGSSISYQLAPIFESAIPSVQDNTLDPEGLFYYPLSFTDKDSVTLDFLNSEAAPISNNLGVDLSVGYKNKTDTEHALDFEFSSNFVKGQTTVLRDELDQSKHIQVGKEKTANKKSSGWSFDGNYYSTYVLIEDEDGVAIDLGSTEMYINNTLVKGKTLLKKGLNFIVTHRSNWKPVDLVTIPQESDQVVDALYPHNHKYLIEGMGSELYGVDLSQEVEGVSLRSIIDREGVYSEPRKCWAIKMREIDNSTFDTNSLNQLDVFCYKIDNTNQERIIVRSSPDNGLINDETFSIITKLHSAESVKGVIFKAVLETTDNKTSPTLTEYLVKIK